MGQPLPHSTLLTRLHDELNELATILLAERRSSAINRTESNLRSIHRRIGRIQDGELTEWQGNIVLNWFLTKGAKDKIARNSGERRERAKQRYERTLKQLNTIRRLLGVLEE